jgi:type IX secretion system PorP/SprF family membrane protein
MKKLLLLAMIIAFFDVQAQDPHYSQFFTAPQLLNPANIGAGQGDWRILSNYRQQWANAGTPFTTISTSADAKVVGRGDEENVLGLGVTATADQSMNGAFKSIYAGMGLAYHIHLNENHQLGLGMQASYGQRKLDYSQLTFGEQFSSGGFDITLPSGETTLSNMRPYISLAAGMLYRFS